MLRPLFARVPEGALRLRPRGHTALLGLALIGCGESSKETQGEAFDAGTADGSLAGGDGDSNGEGDGDADADGDGDGDSGGNSDAESPPNTPPAMAGNPDGRCTQALPAEAKPADVSQPTTVVGTGSAASCSEATLVSAVKKGGVITFNCGADPVTIKLTATLELNAKVDTVIDGGNKITIDGDHKVRIMHFDAKNWLVNTKGLTLQHIALINGKAKGSEAIPEHPEPCSHGFNDGQGGAVLLRDGSFRAIDVTFQNNEAELLGPDTGGGAVYLYGCKPPAYIVSSTFKGNKAANAGALGNLFASDFIYDSLFEDNEATGYGGNDNKMDMCAYKNGDTQYQIGSGGNGGAIYSDGVAKDLTLCGNLIRNNKSGAFGAGIFFTSNDQSMKGTLSIRDTKMMNNIPAQKVWEWKPGISTNANTPEPVNSTITR